MLPIKSAITVATLLEVRLQTATQSIAFPATFTWTAHLIGNSRMPLERWRFPSYLPFEATQSAQTAAILVMTNKKLREDV